MGKEPKKTKETEEKKETPEEKQEKEIRLDKEALQNVLNLKNRIKENPNKNYTNEFYTIVRDFFKRHFKINYEFTYKELAKEVEKEKIKDDLKQEIMVFAEELGDIGFDGQTQLDTMGKLLDFQDILIKITLKDQQEIKKDTFGFFKNLFKREKDKSSVKNIFKKRKDLSEMYSLFRSCYSSLKQDKVSEARDTLSNITEEYEKLTEKQKEKFEKDISELKKQIRKIEEDPNRWRGEPKVQPFQGAPEQKQISFEPSFTYDDLPREKAPRQEISAGDLNMIQKGNQQYNVSSAGFKFRSNFGRNQELKKPEKTTPEEKPVQTKVEKPEKAPLQTKEVSHSPKTVDDLKGLINAAKQSIENGQVKKAQGFYSKALKLEKQLRIDPTVKKILDYELMVMDINLKLEKLS